MGPCVSSLTTTLVPTGSLSASRQENWCFPIYDFSFTVSAAVAPAGVARCMENVRVDLPLDFAALAADLFFLALSLSAMLEIIAFKGTQLQPVCLVHPFGGIWHFALFRTYGFVGAVVSRERIPESPGRVHSRQQRNHVA